MKPLLVYTEPAQTHFAEEALSELQLLPYAEIKQTTESLKGEILPMVHLATTLTLSFDWLNHRPPFLLPENLTAEKSTFQAVALYGMGLLEDAFHVAPPSLKKILDGFFFTQPTENTWLKEHFQGSRLPFNQAVLGFYFGIGEGDHKKLFTESIFLATDAEERAYVRWHYAIALQDEGNFSFAKKQIELALSEKGLPEVAEQALRLEWCRVHASLLSEVVNGVEAIKERMLGTETFYRKHELMDKVADLLNLKAQVAAYENNFSEAIGYLNQAVSLYDSEELPELIAEIQMKKGEFLYQWAKSGAPQFYQEAIKCYQAALSVFKKENAPFQFATIHHQLGVMYAEMPEGEQKKAIWSAIAASSFQEALSVFDKEGFPLEYAAICHNYGTALMKFPEAKQVDHIENALHYFMEALEIRTPDFPQERCMTLLNFLEACWEVGNVNASMEKVRLKDMIAKANEVATLTTDPELLERADQHLSKIKELQKDLLLPITS